TSLSPESPYQSIDQIEPEEIIHLRTGLKVSEAELLNLLAPSRIIYVGEAHDSLADHRVQLKILKGLLARFPGKIAVGMEMFRRSSQGKLDLWTQGKLSDKEFLKIWYEDWRHDDGYYKELLQFIQENHIPVIALRPSAEMSFKMQDKGVDGLSLNDKKKLPEIDKGDVYHREALQAIFKGHGAGADQFDSFYNMMLFWDETMAESVVNFLNSPEGEEKIMVVFAGGFHVGYGFGIPRRVFRRLPVPYQIVIPNAQDFPEGKKMQNVTPVELPLPLADFVWGIGYQALEEKKVRLGVFIEKFQSGARVTDVFPGSVADVAGIQAGDIIASFDDQPISDLFDLTYAVQQKKPGDKVWINLIRNGEAIKTEAVMKGSKHP
ncbi:MAG: ChaN family lipoprotein, partial [Nitrospiria bacterium]